MKTIITYKDTRSLVRSLAKMVNNLTTIKDVNIKNISEYYIQKYGSLTYETSFLSLIDGFGEVTTITLTKGGRYSLPLDVKDIIYKVLQKGDTRFVLGHNHPNLVCQPSTEDIEFTLRLLNVCHLLGLTMLDHVIVTPTASFSIIKAIKKAGKK